MSEVKTITLHDGRILSIINEDWLDFDLFKSRNRKKCRIYLLSKITEEQIVDNKLVHIYDGIDTDGDAHVLYNQYNEPNSLCSNAKQSLLSLLHCYGIDTTKEWVLILKK